MKGSAAVCYCLIIVSFFALFCYGSESFDCYKSIMYSKDGKALGSHRNALSFLAASYKQSSIPESVRSRAILLPYDAFISRTEAFLSGEFERISNMDIPEYQQAIAGGASAVIITIPSQIPSNLLSSWRSAEYQLTQNEILIPVYFVKESEKLNELSASIEAASQISSTHLIDLVLSDDYRLTVSTKESSLIKQVTGTNLQGWLGGRVEASSPTIAIFGSYDAFAAAPELAYSSGSSGTSTAILLELARLFSKLYANSKSHANFNLLFVLTTGNQLNYLGSKEWYSHIDERIAKSLEFVLCLDALGSSDPNQPLYLHSSRPERLAKKYYESFTNTAEQLGRKLELSIQKVNVSNSEEPFEHEVFAKQRVLASTLSSHPTALPSFSRSNIFDNSQSVNVDTVVANTRFVAEALAKYVFNIQSTNVTVFEDAIEEEFLESWLSVLNKTPRFLPFIDTQIVDEIEKSLKTYTADITKQKFTLTKESGYAFFSQPTATQLEVAIAKPFLFDVILAVSISAYLTGLYFAIKYFK